MGTEEALMEPELDLSTEVALGCFYSNLCKWACLHCAGFFSEPGSQTNHWVDPRRLECDFLTLGTDRGVRGRRS